MTVHSLLAAPAMAAATYGRPDVTVPLTIAVVLAGLYLVLTLLRPVAALLGRLAQVSFSIGSAFVVVIFVTVLVTGGVVLRFLNTVI